MMGSGNVERQTLQYNKVFEKEPGDQNVLQEVHQCVEATHVQANRNQDQIKINISHMTALARFPSNPH